MEEWLLEQLGRLGPDIIRRQLERMGHEVLGADCDPQLVQEFAGTLTKTVEAAAAEAQKELGELEAQEKASARERPCIMLPRHATRDSCRYARRRPAADAPARRTRHSAAACA